MKILAVRQAGNYALSSHQPTHYLCWKVPGSQGLTMTNSSAGNAPVFLFGMERSGTTLLSMMMGAHPDVAVPLSTTGIWYAFYRSLETSYNNIATARDMEKLVDDLLAHERIKLWNTPLSRDRILSSTHVGRYGTVINAFHSEYALQREKSRWANIDIATLDNMHIAHALFEDAKFVHIIRDGRDVALSHQGVPFGAGNIADCAEAWQVRVRQNLRMGCMLDSACYLTIRYEDLVNFPEETLTRICAFMNIEFSPEMLSYHQEIDKRIPVDKQWMWPKIKTPPQKSNTYKWKQEMSLSQRIVFENIAMPLLKELNYETFQEIPKQITAYLLELKYFLGRGGRGKRLAERFRGRVSR